MRTGLTLDEKRAKVNAVQAQVDKGKATVAEACTKLGFHQTTYQRWARELKLAEGANGNGHSASPSEEPAKLAPPTIKPDAAPYRKDEPANLFDVDEVRRENERLRARLDRMEALMA